MRFLVILMCLASAGCSGAGYDVNRAEATGGVYHRVRSGDTLSSISNRYGVSLGSVALLNGIRTLDRLDVGELLLVRYDQKAGWSQRVDNTGRASLGARQEPYDVQSDGVSIRQTSARTNALIEEKFRGMLSWPVAGGRIESGFGPRSGSFHDGVDISAPSGTPVFAAHPGRVVHSSGDIAGYGNMVIIQGDGGFTTVYAHNRRLMVSRGDRVVRGQKIAEVGSTGRANGPHLHFELRRKNQNEKWIAEDPIPYFARTAPADTRYRENQNLTPILKTGRLARVYD